MRQSVSFLSARPVRAGRAVITAAALLLLFPAALLSCRKQEPAVNEVVIWTYDSFNSEWGPGPEAARLFHEQSGITVRWVNHGDAGALLARLLLEKEAAGADIILGLDQNLASRALDTGLFASYVPAGADRILPGLMLDGEYRLTPFDYSYFAIVYDSEAVPNPPRSLEDLTKGEFRGKIVLMDPRTSSPGLGFLAWTQEIYGAGWQDYWRRLRPSILTVADGWSSGYGIFTAGDAPLVLSYTTSPGYHLEYEKTSRFRAAIFPEGHPVQIEAAGLLRAAKNSENAQAFLDFMLGDTFQELIPLTNWMYPVTPVPLPESFRINPKSEKSLLPRAPLPAELDAWAALFQER
ncbi:MAG: thiamine ABC transporter substrate-binding protein [Spirochaetaceae bacterium]|jgi:thiamine transport system substrate-binding protein|nr:thiamine ABC transporter substrate-binding protein [Spirochaetaceae bacterium]